MLVASLALLVAVRAEAVGGDLDVSFGGFGTGGQIQDLGFEAVALALDAQGRLILVGSKDNTFYLNDVAVHDSARLKIAASLSTSHRRVRTRQQSHSRRTVRLSLSAPWGSAARRISQCGD